MVHHHIWRPHPPEDCTRKGWGMSREIREWDAVHFSGNKFLDTEEHRLELEDEMEENPDYGPHSEDWPRLTEWCIGVTINGDSCAEHRQVKKFKLKKRVKVNKKEVSHKSVAEEVTVEVSEVEGLLSQQAEVEGLLSQQAEAEGLLSQQSKVEGLLSQQAEAEGLLSQQAKVEGLLSQQAEAEGLLSQQSKVEDLLSQQAEVEGLLSQQTEEEDLLSQQAEVEGLLSQQPRRRGC
jgi:hypothetical protein